VTDRKPPLTASLEADHRELDELLGRFLAAADALDARRAIEEFDERLRTHMLLEEERLYSAQPARKLLPAEVESEHERLERGLLLEHVQIREISGMMRRLLEEKNDLPSARALWSNLARRWDAHTTREERELFPIVNRRIGES